MNKILIAAICCLSLIANAEEKKVYKIVDEQGNVTFSDVPAENAKEVVVPVTPTFKTPDYSSMLPQESEEDKKVDYKRLTITSPNNGQVFWNVEANNIPVTTNLEPDLQPGHVLVINVDGEPITGNILASLFRGSYELVAEVRGSDGEVIISSEPVSIHIKRAVLKKKPPSSAPLIDN